MLATTNTTARSVGSALMLPRFAPKYRHALSMLAIFRQGRQCKIAHTFEVVALSQRWAQVDPAHATIAMPPSAGWAHHSVRSTAIEDVLRETDLHIASAIACRLVPTEHGRVLQVEHALLVLDPREGGTLHANAMRQIVVRWPAAEGWAAHRALAHKLVLHERHARLPVAHAGAEYAAAR